MNDIVVYNYGDQEIETIESPEGIVLSDEQIGVALGYADPAKAIQNIVARNTDELSDLATTLKLRVVEGGVQKTRSMRVWGEQGIMAITFLAKTEKAIAFRKWARETLFAMRQQQAIAPQADIGPALQALAQSMQSIATAVTNMQEQIHQGHDVTAELTERVRRLEAENRQELPPTHSLPPAEVAVTPLRDFIYVPPVGTPRVDPHYRERNPDYNYLERTSPVFQLRVYVGLPIPGFAKRLGIGMQAVRDAEQGIPKALGPNWRDACLRANLNYEHLSANYNLWKALRQTNNALVQTRVAQEAMKQAPRRGMVDFLSR